MAAVEIIDADPKLEPYRHTWLRHITEAYQRGRFDKDRHQGRDRWPDEPDTPGLHPRSLGGFKG